ncbi:hypothetical protein CAPTEDRAFT_191111 [Capitella teleta]|uniref:Uncharacterized protein n=1 Tax=Capitella teleta TaxID=283909 RepID=R7UR13_CAPTE|nr:hypothetical protein CAPTEDRAFT_191111 [Capitella teleta]|eukprot:ELU08595.1 hypothetical protein CAPTEDRAFT_191111 [Capitella teleta]
MGRRYNKLNESGAAVFRQETLDFSNDSDDVSDTETLLNQRLDLHRVRPQSAKGWQLDSPPSDDPTPDFVCVGKNITSGEDFSRSIQRESKLRESVLYKSNRERSLPRKPVVRIPTDIDPCPPPVSPVDDSPPLTRKPSFRHRKLRVAKPPPTTAESTRPRTATGTRRSKISDKNVSLNLGLDKNSDSQTQRLRNSAPASLSRQHKSYLNEDRSYLRMGNSGQLLTPRAQAVGNAKNISHTKLDDIFSSPKKLPSYSTVNREPQLRTQTFELLNTTSPSRRRKHTEFREATRKSRGEKFVTSLRLPPLEKSANINPKDSMGETMPDIFNRS